MEARTHQVVPNKYCKYILGVKDSTPTAGVWGELGQYPLYIFRKLNMVKYWYKIVTNSHDRLRYTCYSYLKSKIDIQMPRQYRNWAAEIRQIFVNIGMIGVWHTEIIDTSYEYFTNSVKHILVDLFITEWVTEMFQRDKLRTYRLFKKVFACESYFVELSPVLRKSMSRLKLSSHTLEIEMGRYPPRVPAINRYCKQCNIHDIDDEFHFILKCTKFSDLHSVYIPHYYRVRPNMITFISLMSTDNVHLRKRLSLFIHKAFQSHT